MKSLTITFTLCIIIVLTQSIHAQDKVQKLSIETEPVAYILGGAGITGSYQYGPWALLLPSWWPSSLY